MGRFCYFAGILAVAAFCQSARNDGSTPNPVVALNRQLQAEQTRLRFEPPTGYLRSLLHALSIPVESQIVVFSKTSLMQKIITPQNPRALYFNDEVAVGWVPGEPFVEVAVADPLEGIAFFTLNQKPGPSPTFDKNNQCLNCHEGYSTIAVPTMLVRSIFSAPDGTPIRKLGEYNSDDRSPFHERWGGWYVTGDSGPRPHLGNTVVAGPTKQPALKRRHVESLVTQFDTSNYLTPYSDVVALLVFDHQMRVMNLLAQLSLDVRFVEHAKTANHELPPVPENAGALVKGGIDELVDSLLFVGEAPLKGPIRGGSGFASAFEGLGPSDPQGRSLRQFDLKSRLMRYPCSYLIYSRMFDELPAAAKEAVYRRLWSILSGEERSPRYAFLTLEKRRAVVEILRGTKKALPSYFGAVQR